MLANIENMLRFFGANYQDVMVSVVIMVSAIIAVIGILKPIVYNRIKNKNIRKAALAFSNIFACFGSAIVYFLIEGWNLKYYFAASLALSVCCIVTYWLYENTCLRNLIGLIGGIALRKFDGIAKLALTTDDVEQVKTEIKNATVQLKATTKQELKKTATQTNFDKDLKGL